MAAPLKDCRDCIWCKYVRGAYECSVLENRYATSWMRHPKNECGTDAKLFQPRPKPVGDPPCT